MVTSDTMAQDLMILALDTDNEDIQSLVTRFLDADDKWTMEKTPENRNAAILARNKMRKVWIANFM